MNAGSVASTDHDDWLVDQSFTCTTPDGAVFPVVVRLGAPRLVDDANGSRFHRCRIGLAPLAEDRWGAGENGFQALCLSLDYVRQVFKVFVKEGGRIHWQDTDSPVDLDSPWFAPMTAPSRMGLRLTKD